MEIKLQHGRKITDATGSHVEIQSPDGQKTILAHSDVVKLLMAMNAASTKVAIAAAQDQLQD